MQRILSFYDEAKKLIRGEMVIPRMVSVWLSHRCNLSCEYCIVEKGKILRGDNKEVVVEKVKIGESLLGYDEEKREFGKTLVIRKGVRKVEKYYELGLENGKILEVTGEHPVMTRRGWVEVRNLRDDDEILVNE